MDVGKPVTHRVWMVLLLLIAVSSSVPAQAPLIGKTPRFEKDILPILTAHCLNCHGNEARKAGLDLRTTAAMT